MRKFLIVIVFFGLISTLRAQESSIDTIVDELATYHEVTNHSSGIAGIVSPQYQLFMKLDDLASDQELIELMKNPSPVVVAYAYWAINDKNSVKISEVLKDHPSKDKEIIFIKGCVGTNLSLLELLQRLKTEYAFKW